MSARPLPASAWRPDAPASVISLAVTACIVAAYVLPGLVGHDPWKHDEAYIFGIVYEMLSTGDWIVPQVAGIPFMEKPPLYEWVAALTASAASPVLPLHDGARLASAVFTLVTVGCVMLSSRLAWGRGTESLAALLALSALGLFMNAQIMIPDLPLMAGFALAMLGFVACERGLRWGGLALGVGIGVGFLAKGLLAPGALALAALVLPLVSPRWRTRAYGRHLAIAALAAAPFLLAWPIALWIRSPALFAEWFWQNNIGRFLGFSVKTLGAEAEPGFYAQAFPWFLFPLWIYLLVGLWRARASYLREPGVQVGLATALSLAFVLVTAASSRVVYALPMLPALALATVGAARQTPPAIDRALCVGGLVIGCAALFVVWTTWAALTSKGFVPWAFLDRWFPGEFALRDSPAAVAGAVALSAGFVALAARVGRAAGSGLALWVASLALAWGLAATLWLPWLDYAKSYRAMFVDMSRHVPGNVDCVGTERFGESERAMMRYVLGIRTVDPAGCRAFVRQGFTQDERHDPPGWRLAWSGARPGDTRERFDLYVRDAY